MGNHVDRSGSVEPGRDYAQLWRAADKIVYSTTLTEPYTSRTRIEKAFDVEAIRELKATSSADLAVGGATLAGHALRAGLVDECRLFINPVIVGSGTSALPDGLFETLELLQLHRFDNGVVYLSYCTKA